MRALKSATVAVFLCFVLNSAMQAATVQEHTKAATHKKRHSHVQNARVTHVRARHVTSGTQLIRERLVRLSTAIEDIELDCSHFANYVYDRAGLAYEYEPSRDLYKGEGPFVLAYQPMPGDLIVWRGHVGIVVDPGEHTFVSKLNSGVKIASWDTHYWKRRGTPRFLRFAGPLKPLPEPDLTASTDSADASGATD
jgi:cell wall-associated NlpC family hydrolase